MTEAAVNRALGEIINCHHTPFGCCSPCALAAVNDVVAAVRAGADAALSRATAEAREGMAALRDELTEVSERWLGMVAEEQAKVAALRAERDALRGSVRNVAREIRRVASGRDALPGAKSDHGLVVELGGRLHAIDEAAITLIDALALSAGTAPKATPSETQLDAVRSLLAPLRALAAKAGATATDLHPEFLATALALGTTTIRDEEGFVETWRIERFRPLAEFIVAAVNAVSALMNALAPAPSSATPTATTRRAAPDPGDDAGEPGA